MRRRPASIVALWSCRRRLRRSLAHYRLMVLTEALLTGTAGQRPN